VVKLVEVWLREYLKQVANQTSDNFVDQGDLNVFVIKDIRSRIDAKKQN
jgi:hypothetical protein